ncbi:MAG: MBL fold metallo-hydrolase [Faecalicoccus sp.]|nr:MBL fold metallo-hydrolase [Faecalicoccus sp.]
MKITFFGTTTLLFDDGKYQILFDAHVTRPSLKKYVKGAEVVTNTQLCDHLIKVHKMNRLRAIFILHTHHDHVMDAPYIANQCNATIYGSMSAKNVALGGNVPEERTVVFEHGSSYSIGDFRIQILKSLHSKPNKLNDDLGQPITEPLIQPASLRAYKEGGSYDFYIEHGDKKYLIRPSFNYIKGQLDGFKADVLFLGVAGLAKAEKSMTDTFFEETVEKTEAKLVIPIHWDNFFSSLECPNMEMLKVIEPTELVFFKLAKYCESKDVNCLIQYPCTSIEL